MISEFRFAVSFGKQNQAPICVPKIVHSYENIFRLLFVTIPMMMKSKSVKASLIRMTKSKPKLRGSRLRGPDLGRELQ